MNPEKLLQPRFEVIADYPESPFTIGDILTMNGSVYGTGNPQQFTREPDKYPHLFRKLPWWEKRERSEMPMYLKHTYNGETTFHKIESWDMEHFLGWLNEKERSCCSLLTWSFDYTYQPATEEEYLNSLKES